MKVAKDTPGGDILRHGHAVMLEWAHTRQRLLEDSARIVQIQVDAEELERIAFMRAMAGVILHIAATGEEFKGRGCRPPLWVLQCCAQARQALIADDGGSAAAASEDVGLDA